MRLVPLLALVVSSAGTLNAQDTTKVKPVPVVHEGIVVQSTRGERRVQDEPVKIEVVTREEIEEKLLMTPGSIAMLLNETSGLRVQETSPALGGALIRIQGLEGRYTQLLSDGLPLYGGQAGSFGLLQIPPMDLAQVEVIKGAASALYGASALGGVVNLISRRPDDENELLLNRTTRGGSDAVLWHARTLSESFGYTLLGSGHLQSSRDIDDDNWLDLPEYRRITVRPRAFWQHASGARIMGTVGTMVETREGGGVVPGGTRFDQRLDTHRFDAGSTLTVPVREDRILSARFAATRIAHDHAFGTVEETDRHTTLFSEMSLRGSSGRHLWVIGAALQRDGLAADDVTGFDYTYQTPSVFVQDEIAFSSRATAALSMRHDWHSQYGAFLAPRASLLLRPAESTNIRLSAGRGYYGPTPFTDETEEVGLTRVAPISGLVAERADIASADIGVDIDPFEINLSVFGSRIRDALDTRAINGRLVLHNIEGDTRTYGTELMLRYHREPFAILLGNTLLDATQPGADGGRVRAESVPRHTASLVAMIEEEDVGRAGLEVYYTGVQRLDDDPFRTDSRAYTLIGLLIERRFGRMRIFINMENLTDVRQTKHHPLVRPAQTSYGRWTTDLWAPVDGRTINGGVRIAL